MCRQAWTYTSRMLLHSSISNHKTRRRRGSEHTGKAMQRQSGTSLCAQAGSSEHASAVKHSTYIVTWSSNAQRTAYWSSPLKRCLHFTLRGAWQLKSVACWPGMRVPKKVCLLTSLDGPQ